VIKLIRGYDKVDGCIASEISVRRIRQLRGCHDIPHSFPRIPGKGNAEGQ
jgi:hypothetical protein